MSRGQEIVAIKRSIQDDFLRRPGVHAVAVGPKFVNGQRTDEIAIQVFVRRKRPAAELAQGEMIPTRVRGVPTDVVESSPPVPLANNVSLPDTAAYRPLEGGSQIQAVPSAGVTLGSGTLGCFAWTRDDHDTPRRAVGLSNHHVLVGGVPGEGVVGERVGQPETWDCGECCNYTIGTVLDAVFSLEVDGATVLLAPGTRWKPTILEIGLVAGTLPLGPDDLQPDPPLVQKRGMDTGLTHGEVAAVDYFGPVVDDNGNFLFNVMNQLRITGNSPLLFANRGDSGSVVVTEGGPSILDRRVVGLLWGGTPITGDGFASPITDVENELHITIATGEDPDEVHIAPAGEGASVMRAVAGAGLASAAGPSSLGLPTRAQVSFLSDQGLDAARWLRSVEEVRELIATNLRVAAIWQRNNGPEVARHVFGGRQLSASSGTRSLAECADRILHVLARYGSAALRSDVADLRRILALPG